MRKKNTKEKENKRLLVLFCCTKNISGNKWKRKVSKTEK